MRQWLSWGDREILQVHGPDTSLGLLASILQGNRHSFYVVTIYFWGCRHQADQACLARLFDRGLARFSHRLHYLETHGVRPLTALVYISLDLHSVERNVIKTSSGRLNTLTWKARCCPGLCLRPWLCCPHRIDLLCSGATSPVPALPARQRPAAL